MKYKFEISGRMPNLNDFILAERTVVHKDPRRHILVTKGAQMKKKWQEYVVRHIRLQLGATKVKTPINIKYTFYEPDKRRDKGNVIAFADKVICDALQQTGTIPNDNWACINSISSDFDVDKENPRIVVELEEV